MEVRISTPPASSLSEQRQEQLHRVDSTAAHAWCALSLCAERR